MTELRTTILDRYRGALLGLAAGDALAEFDTESGLLVVEAAAPGRLAELLIQPGQTIGYGAKLARVEIAGSSPKVETNPMRTENAI